MKALALLCVSWPTFCWLLRDQVHVSVMTGCCFLHFNTNTKAVLLLASLRRPSLRIQQLRLSLIIITIRLQS